MDASLNLAKQIVSIGRGTFAALVLSLLASNIFAADVLPKDGGIWKDDKGVHINAHGGGVLFAEGRYWWFGEHKVAGEAGNKAMVGIHAYSSTDLTNWKDEGIALKVEDDEKSDIRRGFVLERPKVVKAPATGKYVMYFHNEKGTHYTLAAVGIAIADRPAGPYRYVKTVHPNVGQNPLNARPEELTPEVFAASEKVGYISTGPSEEGRKAHLWQGKVKSGQDCRDMTLFQDDDGKTYHVFSSEFNSTLHISELTPDCLDYTDRWVRIAEKNWTEAPALFKRNGWYYLLGSGCTGWKPNAAHAYRAKNIFGPWERLDNPCIGTNPANGLGPEKTWGGQSACVFKVEGKDEYIAMFDVWSPKNAIDGRYIWRRIHFTDDSKFVIPW